MKVFPPPFASACESVLEGDVIANASYSVASVQNEIQELQHFCKQNLLCSTRPTLKHDFVSESTFLDGITLSIPRRDSTKYVLNWTTTIHLPIGVDPDHLRTKVFKGDVKGVQALKNTRNLFDKECPNSNVTQTTKGTARSRKSLTTNKMI